MVLSCSDANQDKSTTTMKITNVTDRQYSNVIKSQYSHLEKTLVAREVKVIEHQQNDVRGTRAFD